MQIDDETSRDHKHALYMCVQKAKGQVMLQCDAVMLAKVSWTVTLHVICDGTRLESLRWNYSRARVPYPLTFDPNWSDPIAMKVAITSWNAVAQWKWDVGNNSNTDPVDDDDEEDVCGICRVAYEACCPACKMPGDDCPLSKSDFHYEWNFV